MDKIPENGSNADAKSQTPQAWGTYTESHLEFDGISRQGTRSTSRCPKGQPFSLSGHDREGGDNSTQSRGTIAGGILKQLIEETRDQLLELDSRKNKLQIRLQQLEQLLSELSQKTGESRSTTNQNL